MKLKRIKFRFNRKEIFPMLNHNINKVKLKRKIKELAMFKRSSQNISKLKLSI
jgi:hypothetical protein